MSNQFLSILKPSEASNNTSAISPSTPSPKYQQYKAEAELVDAETKKQNSFLGILKNTIKGVGETFNNIGIEGNKRLDQGGKNVVKLITDPLNEAPKRFKELTPNIDVVLNMEKKYTPEQQEAEKVKFLNSVGGFTGGSDLVLRRLAGGRLPRSVLKNFADEVNPEIISSNLQKGFQLEKTAADDLAQRLAPTRSIDEVKVALVEHSKSQNPFIKALKGDKPVSPMKEANVASEAAQTTTDDSINPLTNEARKYKSAEEFVKAQETLYRGTNNDNLSVSKTMTNDFGDGLYLTDSKKLADEYKQRLYKNGDGKVQEIYLPKNIKLIDINDSSPITLLDVKKILSKYKDKIGDSGKYLLDDTKLKSVWGLQDGAPLRNYANAIIDIQQRAGLKNSHTFNEVNKILKEKGYDGLRVYQTETALEDSLIQSGVDTTSKNTILFDPSIAKTKSQLTDIYNKAVGETAKDINVPTKQVSQIDKLIAEGKVRVVSRDGRDVYQTKKGTQWLNARDEDSAIAKVTRETTPKEQGSSDELDGLKYREDELKEQVASHPGRELVRFISRKEGIFLDRKITDDMRLSTRERQNRIDQIKKVSLAAERAFDGHPKYNGRFDDPDAIREAIDEYNGLREDLKTVSQNVRDERKVIKDTPAVKKEEPKTTSDTKEKIVPQIQGSEGEVRSIEKQAQQALDILHGEEVPSGVSLPKIIQETVTPVQKKVHFIDTFLTTPRIVMNKIGFGKEAGELRDAMDAYWKELPKNIDRISGYLKDLGTKESQTRVFKYLDGQAIDLTDTEKKVATDIKEWLAEFADRLDLPDENRVTNYITRLFPDTKEFDEDLAKLIADKIPGSVYNPFLLKRLGAEGYKEDLGVALQTYVKRATRKIHMDPVLEKIQSKAGSSLELSNIEKSQFKYIQEYIANINLRPSERDESLDNFIKSIFGYKLGSRPISKMTRFLRQATFRGMLGLNPASALRNLSQGANTYAELGEKYTALGYLNLFKKGANAELDNEGVLGAGFIQDKTMNATKKAIEKADKVLFFMFETAERINRGAAYFGAKAKALNSGKTEEEAIKYAKEIVRKTQFSFDSVDTPVALSSDIAKTFFQFQTFGIKQIEFLGKKVKDKDIKGLLRYILASTIFVYTIGKAFGMKESDIIPMSNYQADVPPSLKLPVEIGKAIFNTPDKYGNKRDTKEKASDIGKAAIPYFPAGSQIKKTFGGLKAIKEGGSYTASGNLQFEQGISTPQKIQSAIFGKYANNKAQAYFGKKDQNAESFDKIKPIYDQIQTLKINNPDEAVALFDGLTPADQAIYKKYKSEQTAQATREGKKQIVPVFQKIRSLKETNPEEALAIYETLSDDQKRYYQLVKKQLESEQK